MLDEETCMFYKNNGEVVYLGRTSTQFLSYLILNKNRYITYAEIVNLLWRNKTVKDMKNRLRELVWKINHKLKGEYKLICKIGLGYRIGGYDE